MSEPLFSLDIGTRSVVGVVSKQNGDIYEVIDYEVKNHPERAMFDGQIHDIEKVAKVVIKVKEELESRTGLIFKKVAIAAAGRALKTIKVKVDRELEPGTLIDKELLNNVEMEGIQKAQLKIEVNKSRGESHYYCVGYNVCNYYIDGNMNINPKDHRGDSLSVELIATFLPHIVVDGLYTVVDRAGLEVINLTLEPIAAINIAIPQNLRLLNLALVDIGAGTSDIAITKDGTVISFGMVAAAGDKFTEILSQSYLLDFDQAENLKISLLNGPEHTFSDIIGMTHTIKTEEIIEKVRPKMIEIAKMITKQILEYNEKIPSAVFCIGGGCQIPGFTEILATELELPKERVIIKPVETLTNVKFRVSPVTGPEFITPLGIGITAIKEIESDFLQIMVNDKSVRLFNSKQLNVSDALILVGYGARNLLPERGSSLAYSMNDKSKVIKGGFGEAAKIYVNGVKASLDVKLKNKDNIYIEPGIKGTNAVLSLKELIGIKTFVFNDERIKNKYNVRVNGVELEETYIVESGDDVTCETINTIEDLLKYSGIEISKVDIYVNGEKVTIDKYIKGNDIIRTKFIDMKKDYENYTSLDEFTDSEYELYEESNNTSVVENNESKIESENFSYNFLVNNKLVEIKNFKKEMVFVDIFDFIDFDTSKSRGTLFITLNGAKAKYTEKLKSGDQIEIKWK